MQPLEKLLRNQLERTIKEARDTAEEAARAALEQLGVGEATPFPHLSDQDRKLRRKLRVHGRQLGDRLNGGKVQEMGRLVEEVAYEHWHRMLFARFLAENNLLMYPDPDDPVAVTLEECEDLACDEGAANGWELAARFAARMLPQIFRLDSPVFQLTLPPEHQQKLERLVSDLPLEVFTASDSLGWVYQFWQAKKKDEVNASEVKIGSRELPAVTQLFTEPYMVSFLLDNALGAWWAARRLSESDLKNATSEEELRQKAAIPGVPLEYLRFIKSPSQKSPSPSGRGVRGEGREGCEGKKTPVPIDILKNARKLRQNQTDAEQLLWSLLRNRRFANKKFRRQHPVGRYILDFYCHELKLAIELDGGQHNELSAKQYDEDRTRYLNEQGIRVIRFWNNEVLQQTESVLDSLWNTLFSLTPTPLPEGEGLFVGDTEGEKLTHIASSSSRREELTHITPSPHRGEELTHIVPSPLWGEGQGEGLIWTPAAGTFDGWPEQLSDLKTLDPCCGSGHFLVAAFLMLVPMRMELEDLSAREAVDAVLRENIHGLELDQRCVELAAFALALTAWKYPNLPSPSGRGAGGEGAIGYRPLPELNVACSGLSVSVAKEEWKQLGLGKKNLTIALDWMHDIFQDAPVLGSLLNPAKTDAAKLVQWKELSSTLEHALSLPSPSGRGAGGEGYEQQEAAVVAQGLAKAATLLAGQYQWVITNVPYLARGKQSETLRKFCEKHYPEAKNDLATVFLDRCLELCSLPSPFERGATYNQLPSPSGRGAGGEGGGTVSVVLPQNWLFLTSYKKFREKLLREDTWHLIARLGENGFDSSAAAGAFVAMLTLSRGNALTPNPSPRGRGEQFLLPLGEGARRADEGIIRGLDVSEPRTAAEKARLLKGSPLPLGEGLGVRAAEIKSVEQAKQLENPDAIIAMEESKILTRLSDFAFCTQGIATGDLPRFIQKFWEIDVHKPRWEFMQLSTNVTQYYDGRNSIILWDSGKGYISQSSQARIQGRVAWGKQGIAVRLMRDLPCSLFGGAFFDQSNSPIISKDQRHIGAIWSYCSSPEFSEAVRSLDQALSVTEGNLLKVPFDLDRWTKVAEEKYPNGLPKPYTSDPTQWIFHGHPCGSVVWDKETKWTAHGPLRTDDTVLQVAVARLLGYRWPAELAALTPNPSPKVRGEQDNPLPLGEGGRRPGEGEMELADEQREWVTRSQALSLTPTPLLGGEGLIDEDGIVCIPSVRGEPAATDRLLNLLAAAYGPSPQPLAQRARGFNPPSPPGRGAGGEGWSNDILAELLKNAGHAGKSLETWLRDKFFTQHCKLFHHRPFIWHIWDGLPDGFAALVNYHKFDRKNLETLIYTYLGDWISRQKQDITSGIDGAEEKLAAAEALKKKLELILEGEAPYDIFVRWKPLSKQPIGWEPDLNDGVRFNIRPFMTVPDVKKKGAGVLRDKPNIKWNKDRGKDVKSAPWYHLFKGDRINDHHLTLAEKHQSRLEE